MEEKYYLRRRAWELRNQSLSLAQIRKELGVSDEFIELWSGRGNAGEGFHDRPRAGAPKKIPADLTLTVKRALKRKRENSSNSAKILRRDHDVDVSSRTVRNFAHRVGLKSYVRPKKPHLMPADKPKRVRFARAHLKDNDLRYVWWTDEKAVAIDEQGRFCWAESRDDVEPREKDLVPKTVRVWAGVSRWGNSKLFRIPSGWDSPTYVNFLKKNAIPNLKSLSGGDFVFEHDGDGAHRGRVVKEYLAEADFQVLEDLPPRSPDIPIVEEEWKLLGDGVRNRSYKTLEGLWRAMRAAWNEISPETVQSLVDSVPNRLREIIRKNGEMTKY